MGELLPCPFCGNRDIEVEREGNSRQSCIVACGYCGCRMESNENGAGDAWNRRTTPPATAKMLGWTKQILASWGLDVDPSLEGIGEVVKPFLKMQMDFLAEWPTDPAPGTPPPQP